MPRETENRIMARKAKRVDIRRRAALEVHFGSPSRRRRWLSSEMGKRAMADAYGAKSNDAGERELRDRWTRDRWRCVRLRRNS